MVLTTAACPVKKELEQQCYDAVIALDSVDTVNITMDAEVPKGRQQNVLPGVKHIIAIASGKGGVGKSTVSVNLACALAATGAKVGLLDADIYGPSIPLMMGIRKEPFVSNKKIIPLKTTGSN